MSRCNLLKNGININQYGYIDYCCEMPEDGSHRPMFSDYTSFHEYRQPLYEVSKTEWVTGCKGCKHAEETKGYSLRTISNLDAKNEWKVAEDDYTIYNAILNLGNICNLACRMCGTGPSTKWQSYQKKGPAQRKLKVKEATQDYEFMDPGQHDALTDEQFEDLKDNVLTPSLRHLVFGGGEPMQNDICMKTLKYLDENNMLKNIDLHIHTNGTQPMDGEWGDVIANVNSLELVYSIDGTGSNYNYIRQDSDWDLVKNNLEQSISRFQDNKNYEFNVAYCFQALNAHKFIQDKEYFTNNFSHNFHYQHVHYPEYLSLKVVHPELRKKYGIEDICDAIPYNEQLARKFIASQRWMDVTFKSTSLKEQNPDFFDADLYPFAEEIYNGTLDWNQDPNLFSE
jgi:organic radical activating enzyme|tara:strand:- start:73 stop:1263 length:1191 start_codon:yes stop_codon:yes gene_type:complete